MNVNEIDAALAQMQITVNLADEHCRKIINRHAKNRLRSLQLDAMTLRALKLELRDFNAHTLTWGNS